MVKSLDIKNERKQQEASYCPGLFQPIPDMYVRLFQNCNKVAYLALKFQKKCKKNDKATGPIRKLLAAIL